MDVLAVIPALHPQDSRPFAGRPLTLHAIDQARAARRVTRVVAVTLDTGLKRLIADEGVEVLDRSGLTVGESLLAAALDQLAEGDGYAPSLAMLLDPGFPLRTPETIDGAIQFLWQCGADTLVAVYPLAEAVWVQEDSGARRASPQSGTGHRFIETGSIAAVRVGAFTQTGELPTGRTVLFEVPTLSAIRIADAADWADAEFLYFRGRAARGKTLLRGVEMLAFDFDGVMTDNRVLVFEDGREAVLCNRGDGMGLEMLAKAGVPLAVISKERNPVVGARCEKLKIPCLQGVEDKLTELTRIAAERGLPLAKVAFMGNDVNDLACMRAVGVAIAPEDSHPEALQAADIVTSAPGGFGAVREVCDLLLAAKKPD